MRWTSCAVLTLTAAALFAAQDAHDLSWKPVSGAKTKYVIQLSSEIDFGAGPSALQTNINVENEVKEVTDEKITIVGLITKFELMVDGQDMTSMMDGSEDMKKPVTRTFSKRGVMLSSDAASLFDNPRFEQLRVFTYPEGPIKVGESWTNESKGDKGKAVPPSRAKFTLDGIEQIDGKPAYRVKFAYSELEGEKPMGAMGTAWVDQATGDLIKTDADINDAQFAEEMPPMHFKMKVRRQ